MAKSPTGNAVAAMLVIAVFVAVGIPLLAYIWETVNQILSGHLEAHRVLPTLIAVSLLFAVFRLASMTLSRWQGERKE